MPTPIPSSVTIFKTRNLQRAALALLLPTLACSALPVPEPETQPGARTPVVVADTSTATRTTPATPAAQRASSEAPSSAGLIPFDPAVRRGTLDNGLQFYIRRNVKPESRAELRLVINAGSLLEDEDQLGLAHFVEHMAFNGTENFEKQELVEYLERIGMRFGPDINAYTSFDETVYMLQIPTDDEQIVSQAFQILEDWAHGVEFEGEEIDKERGVVVEEWRLRRGAGGRIQDKQIPVLYHDSRYAERLPIGKKEVLETASHDALRRFYRDWYRPNLMAVVAVGDFDEDDIERRIRDHFGDLENPETVRERKTFGVPGHEETLFSIVQDPEATNISVTVGYKGERSEYQTLDDMRESLVESLYDGLLIARLGELSQKADPPFQFGFAATSSLGREDSAYRLFASVRDGGVERGLSTLLTEAKRVEKYGFNPSELERAKADVQRGIERSWEERDKQESGRYASQYVGHFLRGSAQPSMDFVKESMEEILPKVTLDEVNALAEGRIKDEDRVILVSGPETEAAGIPDEAALLDVFEQAQQVEVTPWVDQTRDAPLVPSAPTPGRVTSTQTIDELGVTVWTLSNGIEVQVKPTDFKNDEVLLRGTSPGGHSLVDNDDFITASQASGIVGLMGLGEFSAIELDKALTGKVARAQSFIGALSEGVVGFASPKDLETMMQLVHLQFVAPRRDEEAFQSFLTRTRGFLENQQASPNYWYQKRWIEVANQNHPRRQMLTPEKLEQVELDRALELYRERFADASDFLFTIVGNVDLDELQPLVETWLGSLPDLGREEEGQDTGGYAPPEELSFTVEKGLEPKATVRLVFHGDAEWSPEANHVLGSMANVLRMRLREVLREDLGGVYGVGVGGNISIRPVQRYNVSISFGCDPERVDELIAAVRSEIERLQTEGPEQDDIDKVREIQRRGRETALDQNGFWASVLEAAVVNETDPLDILNFDERVELVTQESVQEAAKKYMQRERSVLGILLPEETEEASAEG